MSDVGVALIVVGGALAVVAICITLLAFKLSDAKDEGANAQQKQVLAERDTAIERFKLAQVEAELARETAIEKAQDKEIGDAINTKPNTDLAADDLDSRIKRLFASWRAAPAATPIGSPAGSGSVSPPSAAPKA